MRIFSGPTFSIPSLSGWVSGLAVAGLLSGAPAQEPQKKAEDPDRIPKTSIPVVSPPKDAVVVGKKELETNLGIKIEGELSLVRTKNITLHYVPTGKTADELKDEKKEKLKLAEGIEAHLDQHAKLFFGKKDYTLNTAIDVYLSPERFDVPGIGNRRAVYIGQQSVKEPTKLKLNLLGASYGGTPEQFTKDVRHELFHALVRNEFPSAVLAIALDEGGAQVTEKGTVAECEQKYLGFRGEKGFEKYSTANRLLQGLNDDGKKNDETVMAYTMRCLFVGRQVFREAEVEKGFRKFGAFLEELDKEKVLGKDLNRDTEDGYARAAKAAFGMTWKEVTDDFDRYLMGIKKAEPKKDEPKK